MLHRKRGAGKGGPPVQPTILPPDQRVLAATPPPEWLTNDAAEFWEENIPLFAPYMTVTDLPAFGQLAFTFGMMMAAVRGINDRGARGALQKNPACSIFRENQNAFHSLGARFGVNPSARTALLKHGNTEPDTKPSALSSLIR